MKKSNRTIARKSLGRVEISTIAALGLLGVGVEAAAQSATDDPLDSIDGVTGYEILPDDSLLITLESGETLTLAADAYVIVGEQVFLREGGAAILEAALAGGVDAALLLGGAFAGLSGLIAATDDGGDDNVTPPTDTTPPSFTSDATASTAENVSTDTVVYDADATDANTITYALSGADADFFEIDSDTGEVTFIDSPDFDAEADANGDNVFEITITASDGTNSSSLDVAITLTDLDDEAPVITSESTATVAENPADGQVVYTATATDVDSETVTFSVAGADAALFEINAETGEVSFVGSPDYDDAGDADGDNVYQIQVIASDGTNSSTQTVEITVTDVDDEAPVFTSATSVTGVREDETDTIYTATVSDLDSDTDSITYRLADSGDSQYFNIDPDTGAVTLGSLIDHENPLDDGNDNSYTIEIIASDGSNETTHTVTIEITDVADEGPVFTTGTTASVEELSVRTSYIPAATPDVAGAEVTYEITGGADGALFKLDEDSGELEFISDPDHEQPKDVADAGTGAIAGDNIYEVEITATDEDGNETSQIIQVTVTDTADSFPSFSSGTTISVNENESDTGYTAVAAPDVDGATVTYTLTGGADEARFKIDSTTGKLSFADGFTPDYEIPGDGGGSIAADNVYEVEITATDEDGVKSTQLVRVTVNDIDDEAPVFTSGTNPSAVPEDETDVVYVAEATDPDSDDGDITYALADGGDNQFFDIDADTGQVTLRSTIDHDTANDADGDHVYDIQIIASDGTHSSTHDVAITITDAADEDPHFESGTTASVDEGKTITNYTPDATPDVDGTPVTYKIVGGKHGYLFDIDPSTGKLVFKNTPDYEAPFEGYATTRNAYYVIGDSGPDFLDFEGGLIEDEDGDGYLDPGEAVTITSARGTITSHSFVGTVEIDGHTIVVTTSGASGNPADGEELIFWVPFGVDPDTINFPDVDELRALLNSDAFSDEAFSIRPDNQYEVTIEASDGTNTSTQTVIVAVNDVDEDAPVFSNTETDVSVDENTGSSTVVFDANATDPNGPDAAIKYSLSGEDAAAFDIDEDTGEVTFKDTLPAPDHENPADADQDGIYEITITATDSENKSTELAVTITIDDVSETGPAFTSATTVSVNENETETGYIAQATPDVETEDVSYSITGGAHGDLFSVNSSTGELTFKTAPDYEVPPAAWSAGSVMNWSNGDIVGSPDYIDTFSQPWVLTEAGTASGESWDGILQVGERMGVGGADATFEFYGTLEIDGTIYIVAQDTSDSSYYVFSPTGMPLSANDMAGLSLSDVVRAPLNIATTNEYQVEIAAEDETGNATIQIVTVTVNNTADEGPVFTSGTTASLDENETETGYTPAADPDLAGSEVAYEITGGADAALFDLDADGQLVFITAPDHEAPGDAAGSTAAGDNVYEVEITATDEDGNETVQTVEVTVNDTADEDPDFTSDATVSVSEGETETGYTAEADPDVSGAQVTYAITGGAQMDLFDINQTTGEVTFKQAPNFDANDASNNTYEIIVTATETNGQSATQTVTITVTEDPGVDLGDLDAADGATIYGESHFAIAGRSVSNAGDVNGDGIDDFIIGAPSQSVPGDDNDKPGFAYVIYGGQNLDAIDLDNLTDDQGFIIKGAHNGSLFGSSVSAAGDVNGDGYDDVIIGAPNENYGDGAAYIIFGGPNQSMNNLIDVSSLIATQGARFEGPDDREYGLSVSSAGDVNGDGVDDFLIGSRSSDTVYVIYGGQDFDAIDLTSLSADQGFTMTGASYATGRSVSSAGDVNGDGYEDLLVGSPEESSGNGAVYLILGGPNKSAIDLTSLDPADGIQILGQNSTTALGFSVSKAGDVNGDGFDDLIIAAPYSDANGNDAGRIYIIYGSATPTRPDLDNLTPDQGVSILGVDEGDFAGRSVSNAGDVNGDGYDDLIIGAPSADPNGEETGAAYVIYGGPDLGEIDLGNLTAAQGFTIEGADPGEKTGVSVSSAGDVNGDGYDDLIVGASEAKDGSETPGAAYIIYGGATGTEDTTPLTLDGTDAADNLIGNAGDDSIGDVGTGDVARGGAGDDEISIDESGFAEADGGHGRDTLRIEYHNGPVDIRAPQTRIESFEVIVLENRSVDRLILDRLSVLRLSEDTSDGITTLTIDGNGEDTVEFADLGWTYGGTEGEYDIWQNGNARVLVKIGVKTDFSATQNPSITSDATASVDENVDTDHVVYDANASDGDSAQSDLTYSLGNGGDNALFDIDARTGEVTFKTSPDHEAPTDADGQNDHEITVIVTDEHGNEDRKIVTITVNDITDAAPEFTSGSTASIDENQTNTGYFPAATPDGDGAAVRYEITGGVDRAQFDIDATTGELIFVSAPDHEDPKDRGGAKDDNVYEVRITATDETTGRETDQIVYVTVNDVVDEVPTFDSALRKSVDENTSGPVYTAVVTPDVEGTKVTYSLGDAGDSALFDINEETGELSFKSPPDFEYPLDTNENNFYGVTIVANVEGQGTVTQSVGIEVVDVDDGDTRPPEFNAPSVVYVDEGALLAFEASATDPLSNDAPVRISIIGEDAAAFNTNNVNDNIYFWSAYRPDHENPTDNDGNNEYKITLSATNSRGETATHDVIIRIRDIADEAPSFTSESTASVSENETETGLFISATPDLDGAEVTYSIVGGAHGYLFEIDPQTRELKFKEAPDFEAPPSAYEYDSVVEFSVASGNTSINHNADGTRIISDDPESSTEGVINPGDTIWIDGAPAGTYYGHVTIGGHTMIVTSVRGSFDTTTSYKIFVPVGVDPDSINFDLSAVSRTAFELPKTNEYEVIVEAEEGGRASQQRITITVEDVDETAAAATANAGDLVDLLDNLESEVISTPPDPNDGKTLPPTTPVAPQLTPDWWPQDELVSTLSHLDMSDALDGF